MLLKKNELEKTKISSRFHDNIQSENTLLLQTLTQTFPHYSGTLADQEQLVAYMTKYRNTLKNFLQHIAIASKDELFQYLYASDMVTPYQKKTLKFLEKRSKEITIFFKEKINNTKAYYPDKRVTISFEDIIVVSAIGNMNFDTALALVTLHEYNHLFNNFSEYLGEGVGLFSIDKKKEKKRDRFWKIEQENSKKTDLWYQIARDYHQKYPYQDFFRTELSEKEKDFVLKSKDEFLTESVSNEHFMEWLSHIPHNNPKSNYDSIIQGNIKDSGIILTQNSLLYSLLDFYYANLNQQAKKLADPTLGGKFFAYKDTTE